MVCVHSWFVATSPCSSWLRTYRSTFEHSWTLPCVEERSAGVLGYFTELVVCFLGFLFVTVVAYGAYGSVSTRMCGVRQTVRCSQPGENCARDFMLCVVLCVSFVSCLPCGQLMANIIHVWAACSAVARRCRRWNEGGHLCSTGTLFIIRGCYYRLSWATAAWRTRKAETVKWFIGNIAM